jgi:integrase
VSVSKRKDTGKFVVRWREGGRAGRQRSRSFDFERDAKAFDREVQRLAQLGHLGHLDAGKVTLAEWVETWWAEYAIPNLKPRTRQVYMAVWGAHVCPTLGATRLRDLTPAVVDDLRAMLARRGVGDPTIIKALTMLQGALAFAELRGVIGSNPVKAVRKPRQRRTRDVEPLTPDQVEALRAELGARDAALCSVLAYAGPRPGEALTLEWRHVGRRTLRVKAPKRHDLERTVKLLAPLATDLAEYRLVSGRPGPRALLFPRPDGQPWRDTDLRNWRRRVFQPAAGRAGIRRVELEDGTVTSDLRPYDLRHSFVSLLIGEGQTVVEVARQAGHSAQTCLKTYAHVFDDFDPGDRVPAEERIRLARDRRGRRVL